MNYKHDRMSGLLNFRQTVYSVLIKRYQDILSGCFGLCLTEYDTGMLFDPTTCINFHADFSHVNSQQCNQGLCILFDILQLVLGLKMLEMIFLSLRLCVTTNKHIL